jgi:hypothetical protein
VSDRLALANAIEDAGIPRDKAQRMASVIFDAIHDNVATKADFAALGAGLRADIAALGAGLRTEIASLATELRADNAAHGGRIDSRIERLDATVKAQPNAIMLRLGGLTVVLAGILLAALRYLPPVPHP